MQKMTKGFLLVLMTLGIITFLPASEIINIQLRFYQGFRHNDSDPDSARSFFFREGNQKILSETEIFAEKKSLKDIYNLREIKNITNLSIEFYQNTGQHQTRKIIFKKNALALNLMKYGDVKNKFRIKITKEKENDKALMNTDIVLPPSKATVIGFSDTQGNIYFLSFHRSKNLEYRPGSLDQLPQIRQNSIPEYPFKALSEGIEGNVILEGDLLPQGKVGSIRIWHGDPQLTEAAVAAFKNWRFTSYNTELSSGPLKMVLIFVFKITPENVKRGSYNKILAQIKKTDVWKKIEHTRSQSKQKPWLLYLTVIQGKK